MDGIRQIICSRFLELNIYLIKKEIIDIDLL